MWTDQYATDYHWPWHICACTFILFQCKGNQWYAYPCYHCHMDCLTYPNQASLTSAPTNIVPATSTITTTNIHLDLPITGLIQQPAPVYHPTPVLVRLMTPPVTWAAPLWHNIQPHTHMDTLWFHIVATTCILIVSDMAVHPDGSGTCTWTLWAILELWSGEAHVPAHHNNMYSGLAEAFGIYMALSFFNQYCIYHPVIMMNPCTIHIYCNNKGVLNCSGRKSTIIYP